jgi:hypothetical protein
MDGVAALMPVEARSHRFCLDRLRIKTVVGCDRDLDPVARRKDHGFVHALARPQVGQRGRQ